MMSVSEKPVQYHQGWVEFYKIRFKVSPAVLIPRPETELLVEWVIKMQPKTVLDIGTGSGNIAICIAKNLADIKIVATDVSGEALKIAKQNTRLHGVLNKISFVESDLLSGLQPSDSFDVIVTNLPYIPTARIAYLDSSVKDYEPHIALDGGEDGFELYRELFKEMVQKKIYPKYLIGEIDYTQAEIAQNEANKYFPKCQPEIKFDLAHKQRYLLIRF